MQAFMARSDGLLFAAAYVSRNSAAYFENMGTSFAMRAGASMLVRS
jgi:hypothetical protein